MGLWATACSSGDGTLGFGDSNPAMSTDDDAGSTGESSGSSSGASTPVNTTHDGGASPGTSSSSGSGSSSSSSSGGPSQGTPPQDAGSSTPTDAGSTNNRDASRQRTADASTGATPDASTGMTPDAGNPQPPPVVVSTSDAGVPTGWLYTSGNKIFQSTGAGGTQWIGRGVNMDDIFLCGYNDTLWMTNPAQTSEALVTSLMTGWKPNFVRISLAMDSHTSTASWLTNAAAYKTPMTSVIEAIGANPNVYALVTVRSDLSMIDLDQGGGDPEATGVPSNSTNTPNATLYPTGTDAVYVALVDSFANDKFVMFGLTNEPGGSSPLSNSALAAAMNHAVGTIRAEEDRLGVPHHIVSVQGNGWASDVSFYGATPRPIAYDNVVYEIHGYPPSTASYTNANIPVIIGEYGSLTAGSATAFFADLEAKQISSLAWDFDPFSDCSPDLLNITSSTSGLQLSSWGTIVQGYLLAHAL